MESNMREAMNNHWAEWSGSLTEHYIEIVNSGYEEGFESCHDILMPLLIEAMPHVYANAGAAHLTDGFRPQRKKIDDLVDRIKAVLPE